MNSSRVSSSSSSSSSSIVSTTTAAAAVRRWYEEDTTYNDAAVEDCVTTTTSTTSLLSVLHRNGYQTFDHSQYNHYYLDAAAAAAATTNRNTKDTTKEEEKWRRVSPPQRRWHRYFFFFGGGGGWYRRSLLFHNNTTRSSSSSSSSSTWDDPDLTKPPYHHHCGHVLDGVQSPQTHQQQQQYRRFHRLLVLLCVLLIMCRFVLLCHVTLVPSGFLLRHRSPPSAYRPPKSLHDDSWRFSKRHFYNHNHNHNDTNDTNQTERHHHNNNHTTLSSSSCHEEDWTWDHFYAHPQPQENVVVDHRIQHPTTTTTTPPTSRNLLLAQIVGGPRHEGWKDDASSAGSSHHHHHRQQQQQWRLRLLLSDLTVMTRRVNRAYARQWNHDFVQVPLFGSPPPRRPHNDNDDQKDDDDYDMIYTIGHLLKVLRDKQQQAPSEDATPMTENEDSPSPPPPPYDVVAILLPGSIILDFDYDLFTLLFMPPDPFMATSWDRNDNDDDDDSVSGIIFINLQHALANTLIDTWWSRVQEKDPLSPLVVPKKKDDHVVSHDDALWWGGAWRLVSLRPMIESLLAEMPRPDHRITNVTHQQLYPPEEEDEMMMRQLVRNLPQERDGFIVEHSYPPITTTSNDTDHLIDEPSNQPHYPYCLKGFSVPSALSMFHTTPPGISLAVEHDDGMDHNETATFMAVLVTIQTMADAVCYRFYPKCEIL